MTLQELNSLDDDIGRERLSQCCGSQEWVNGMLQRRPFADYSALHAAADEVWQSLDESDWLEAFAKHPKIGELNAQSRSAAGDWSVQEQRGMDGSSADQAAAMRELNRLYESKFGWIFIVCATAKSAEEMMQSLEERLANGSVEEMRVAAAEQAKITRLRLQKLLAQ